MQTFTVSCPALTVGCPSHCCSSLITFLYPSITVSCHVHGSGRVFSAVNLPLCEAGKSPGWAGGFSVSRHGARGWSLLSAGASWLATSPTGLIEVCRRPGPSVCFRRPQMADLMQFLLPPVQVWEGLNVVKTGRVMLGETNPADSKPGTIRGDFCIQVGR